MPQKIPYFKILSPIIFPIPISGKKCFQSFQNFPIWLEKARHTFQIMHSQCLKLTQFNLWCRNDLNVLIKDNLRYEKYIISVLYVDLLLNPYPSVLMQPCRRVSYVSFSDLLLCNYFQKRKSYNGGFLWVKDP